MIITLIFQIITDIVYTGASVLFYSSVLSMRYKQKKIYEYILSGISSGDSTAYIFH